MMEDIQLSDAVERFLQGQMDAEELSRCANQTPNWINL